jgi:alpha-D-xyloside xylohydrolase
MNKLIHAMMRIVTAFGLFGSATFANANTAYLCAVPGGFLQVTPITDQIVQVAFAKDRAFFTHNSFAVLPQPDLMIIQAKASRGFFSVALSPRLSVLVNTTTGTVEFRGPKGRRILAEMPGGRTLDPAIVQGEKTFHVQQRWEPIEDESLYGLGQNQLGLVDI